MYVYSKHLINFNNDWGLDRVDIDSRSSTL